MALQRSNTRATNPELREDLDLLQAQVDAGGSSPVDFDEIRLNAQTSAPSSAVSGEVKLRARAIAKSPILEVIAEVGDPFLILPGITDPLVTGWWNVSSSLTYKNMLSTLSTDGTVSWSNVGGLIGAGNYATVASANTGAGLYSTSAIFKDGSSLYDGGLFWGMINLPDSSYGSGATGSKIVVGLHDTVGHNGNRPGGNGVLFEYNTNQSDVNWKFIVSDGGSNTIVDSGVPFVAQASYVYVIHIPRGGSACHGFISRVGSGVSATVTASAMPTSTAMYYLPARLSTLSATVRNIRSPCGFMRHGGAI